MVEGSTYHLGGGGLMICPRFVDFYEVTFHQRYAKIKRDSTFTLVTRRKSHPTVGLQHDQISP